MVDRASPVWPFGKVRSSDLRSNLLNITPLPYLSLLWSEKGATRL
jgi:hypothetical protein